jgi:predicted DNA-binding transcriptional regulator YafY
MWLAEQLEHEDGVTRADLLRGLNVKNRQNVGKWIRAIEAERNRRVEVIKEPGHTGKVISRYRFEPRMPQSIELPLDHAIASIGVLRQFSETNLGAAGTGPRRFATTLKNSLPANVQAQLEALADRVSLEFNPTKQGCSHAFSTLVQAILAERTVILDYASASGSAGNEKAKPSTGTKPGLAARIDRGSEREMEVHAVFFRRRALYAILRDVGWRRQRKYKGAPENVDHPALRTFKLSRIRSIRMGERAFKPIAGFCVSDYLRDTWELVRMGPDTPLTEAVIHVDPKYAENIRETDWHPSQRVMDLKDGTKEFRFKVRGFHELRHWLAWLGEGAEIVSPPEWREEMKDMLSKMAGRYNAEKVYNRRTTTNG